MTTCIASVSLPVPLSIRRASGAVSTTSWSTKIPPSSPRDAEVALERPGVIAQLVHRRVEGLAVRWVPAPPRDLDPAAGPLDVDQVDRVAGDQQNVDVALPAVLKGDVDVVPEEPVVRGRGRAGAG